MKSETHKQLFKELYRDIKYYFGIYREYETKDFSYLLDRVKHSFKVYFHKLKTEKELYKQYRTKK